MAAETVAVPMAAMKRRARNGDMRSKESGPFIIVRRENGVIAMGGFLIPPGDWTGVYISMEELPTKHTNLHEKSTG